MRNCEDSICELERAHDGETLCRPAIARIAPLRGAEPARDGGAAGAVGELSLALETGERPLTAAVTTALARHYPQALAAIEGEAPARRLAALGEALADPAVALLDADEAARLAEERPEIADRLIALHAAKRAAEERLAIAEESMTAGTGARLPWEAVRDWFHEAGNYVDPLDRAAEELAATAAPDWDAALTRHGIALAIDADEDAPSPASTVRRSRSRPRCRRRAAAS